MAVLSPPVDMHKEAAMSKRQQNVEKFFSPERELDGAGYLAQSHCWRFPC